MIYILLTALFCLIPAGVIWLCRKYPFLDTIGPIMILYAIGIVIGNLPFMAHPLYPRMGNTLSMSHPGIFHDAPYLTHSDNKLVRLRTIHRWAFYVMHTYYHVLTIKRS